MALNLPIKHEKLSNRDAASSAQTLKRDLGFPGMRACGGLGETQAMDDRLAVDLGGKMNDSSSADCWDGAPGSVSPLLA